MKKNLYNNRCGYKGEPLKEKIMTTKENNKKTVSELFDESKKFYNEYRKYDAHAERIQRAIRFLMKYVDMHIEIDYKVYYKTIAYERYKRMLKTLGNGRTYYHNIAMKNLRRTIEIDEEISKMLEL